MTETETRIVKHRAVVERDPNLRFHPWRWSVEVRFEGTRYDRWSPWRVGRARSYAAACRGARRNMFLSFRVPGGEIREEMFVVHEYEAYPDVRREYPTALPAKHLLDCGTTNPSV